MLMYVYVITFEILRKSYMVTNFQAKIKIRSNFCLFKEYKIYKEKLIIYKIQHDYA